MLASGKLVLQKPTLLFLLSRQGFDSHILRFSARLLIDGKVDAKRKFVISYFLSDDTILVTLVPELNSGKMDGPVEG